MVYELEETAVPWDASLHPHNFAVAARCPFGYPAVIETEPLLPGDIANLTPLYLSCPALVAVVTRAEDSGKVAELQAACGAEGPIRGLLVEASRRCQQRRATLVREETAAARQTLRLGAGRGGPENPDEVSCLHAYAATLLAVLTGRLVDASPADRELVEQAEKAWARFLPEIEGCWCPDGRCSRWDTGRRRGVIEVGATSVGLLVADVGNGWPRTVLRRGEITGLGEGLKPGGALSDAGRRRTAQAASRLVSEARASGVDSLLVAATQVAREATDGKQFIHDLGQENAVPTVVLTAAREAELTYAGVSVDLPGGGVVLGVGGVSSMLIAGVGRGVVEMASLGLGASRATDVWVTSDPPGVKEMAAVYLEAAKAFYGMRPQFSSGLGRRRLVGVGGTITTLACLGAGLERCETTALHLRELSAGSVKTLVACLSAMTTQERAALAGMPPGRASIIVAGTVIVQAAIETLGYETLTVSEHDLLDGLVLRGASPRSGMPRRACGKSSSWPSGS